VLVPRAGEAAGRDDPACAEFLREDRHEGGTDAASEEIESRGVGARVGNAVRMPARNAARSSSRSLLEQSGPALSPRPGFSMRTTCIFDSRITVSSIFPQPSRAPKGFSTGPHDSHGSNTTTGSFPGTPWDASCRCGSYTLGSRGDAVADVEPVDLLAAHLRQHNLDANRLSRALRDESHRVAAAQRADRGTECNAVGRGRPLSSTIWSPAREPRLLEDGVRAERTMRAA
jgi:hypothetical protein